MLQDLDRARLQASENKSECSAFTFQVINRRFNAIEAVVNKAMASGLNTPAKPGCATLERELRETLSYGGRPNPDLASVVCVPRDSASYYVVAYDLMVGPSYSRSLIGVFGPQAGGGYALLGSALDSLPSKTVALALLPVGAHGQLRFLAYGINWGDPHSRLTVIAYSLSRDKLEAIWARRDLPEGRIQVRGGRIELNFLNMAVGPGFGGVREVKQVFRVTSSGVMLARASMGPSSVGVKPPTHTKGSGKTKPAR